MKFINQVYQNIKYRFKTNNKINILKQYISQHSNNKTANTIYIDTYDIKKDQLTLRYFHIDDCDDTFMLNNEKVEPSQIQIQKHYLFAKKIVYEKIIVLQLGKNSTILKIEINNILSQLSLGNRYYKNGIYIIDIENFFNDTHQTYHSIENITIHSKFIEIEAQVSCETYDNIDYFWSSISDRLPHRKIGRYDNFVRYKVQIQNNKRPENETENFYAFTKSGKKVRVWKPSHYLSKDHLPKGFYFTNRYLNLSYKKIPPSKPTLFTPILGDVNYTDTSMHIQGYLFLPIGQDYDTNGFKLKLSKFRDETISIRYPLQLISPHRSRIFKLFPAQNFYKFNQSQIFLFDIEIPLVSISNYRGMFHLGIEYNKRIRLIQNYHPSLSQNEHLTTYKIDKVNLALFNYHFDDISSVWRFEIYQMSQDEFSQLEKLKSEKNRDKNIWLIGEYNISARDNGMHFYHYMLREHPEIDVYYVIEKNSSDLPYVDQEKVLFYGSYKHFVIASKAKVLVFSHMERYLIPKINSITQYKKDHNPYLKVFLQHGVMATTASIPSLHKKLRNYDIFNVSSEFEKDVVKNYLGYSEQEIVINGLPRWDRLYKEKTFTKTILIIPTWRNELEKVTDEVFQQSEYFKFWNSLLSNKEFILFIEENDIQAHFFIHIILSRFIHLFSSSSKNILFKNSDNIQDLLLNCGMLITDYSSVSFDALYQDKPVIYVPFDYEKMIKQRGGKQLINYHNDLPGPVCYTISETIATIVSTVNHEWVIDTKYHDRRQKFFKYIDDNNSKRIYQSIISKLIAFDQ